MACSRPSSLCCYFTKCRRISSVGNSRASQLKEKFIIRKFSSKTSLITSLVLRKKYLELTSIVPSSGVIVVIFSDLSIQSAAVPGAR